MASGSQNTKALIIRQGMSEIRSFTKLNYPYTQDATFWESCGLGDLVATCYGGRNHRVAEEWAKRDGKSEWKELERVMLNGQKLQGTGTCDDVWRVVVNKGVEREFPLFGGVWKCVWGNVEAREFLKGLQVRNQ